MRSHFVFFLSVAIIMYAAVSPGNMIYAAEYKAAETSIFDRDSTYLDTFILGQMDTLHIPGLTACVIKDGQIIWTGAYGYANIAQGIEAEDTTLFMLASISKTVTGTALMQLWENGMFDLDDNINNYLPFPVTHPFYPDSAITFRMLLTHTASIIDDWFILAQSFNWGGDSPIPLDTFLYNYLVPGGYYYSPSNFGGWVPGSGYFYCNVAIALGGYLVERMNDSFPVHCSDSIFEPLQMNETSWFLAGLDTNNVAIPYQYTSGQFVPYGHWGHPMYPAFQLRTSTLQLARYLITYMQYGLIDTVRILDSATVDLMTTVQDSTIAPDQGIAWQTYSIGGRSLWGHSGGTLGVRTDMWFCRDENSGVIVLTNSEADSLDTILHELFEFAAQYGITEHHSPPATIANLQVSPNPFTQQTEIRYTIEEANQDIRGSAGRTPEFQKPGIKICDVSGRLVRSFRITPYALRNTLSWDGRDEQNRMLGSGVYFVKLSAGDYSESKKVLLVR